MKLYNISAENFKSFKHLELNLDGCSTVFFGVNGTGKSSILSIVNYLFWNWIYRLNPSQGTAYRSFTPENVSIGKSLMEISASIRIGEESICLERSYKKARLGKKAMSGINKKEYDRLVDTFSGHYLCDDCDMPVFVNYGTNRSVLEIPLRIRQKHSFSKLTSIERAIENELDFKTFFEWYRNQEDIENEIIRETGDQSYEDKSLKCVRKSIEAMLGDVSDLKVKRSPLRMTVKKGNVEVRVDQLSDGEKCTLALLGDLARRIALANPNKVNPLEGEGIVLIDEIELHMHPSWQRLILSVLRSTFPNIQFVITTHSPQVLGELDTSYKIYKLNASENEENKIQEIRRLDGYDVNYILEEEMQTSSKNRNYEKLIESAKIAIRDNEFEKAEELISQVADCNDKNYQDVIMLEGYLKRSRYLYAKNNQG